jgi:hypothetical protein
MGGLELVSNPKEAVLSCQLKCTTPYIGWFFLVYTIPTIPPISELRLPGHNNHLSYWLDRAGYLAIFLTS